MADEKKTQLGTPPGRTHRPTGNQTPAVAAATGTPVPGESVAPKTSYIPDTTDPLLGSTLAGRYLIQKKLGEGGMGAVYLATHTILEKQVALKVLHGEFARKQDLVERFMQEAKAASRIRHENVIDISDFGSTPEGLVFFAMELLKGHDLHDEVSRARLAGHLLPWSRTKKIFLQICGALSAAHAKGIVHRDLKPENVYLVEFLGDGDFVKLLDFGIAKLTEAEGEGGRKLTKTGMLFGTPEYMSPEQARGEAVDHRVDVYAMGCILFQLVTNRVPFEAENFMGVLSLHLTEPPPTIAPEVFDQIGAPRALADVIAQALEKDRNARWQTIDELANAIREVCGDPAPADRSQPNRAPSVPAPANTTTRSTGPAKAERTRTPTGRQKTQWTGSLKVPEVAVDAAPQPKSKLPLILGAVALAGGGVIAAIVLTRGGGGAAPSSGVASGSAAGSALVAPTAGSATTVTPPPPPPEPALPDMAKLELDSTPHGATVTDLSTGKLLGKTPLTYSVPGSKAARQFQFHLHGFGDTTVELVPNHDKISYVETLHQGASSAPVVHKVPDATIKPVPDTGSGAVTRPDTTVKPPDTTVKPPDTTAKPPDTTTKPPDTTTKPPDDDCPGDEPCIKKNIPGLKNGGSGT